MENMTNGTLSAGDILALSKDTGAMDWSWIIGLLVIAGIFNGGMFGGNTRGVTEEYVANQFSQRDLYNNNTNILSSAAATQNEILTNRANCNNNYSNLRYDMATTIAGVDKDVLLGNQAIQGQMAQNALQAQANLDSCCCTLRSEFRDQIQGVKDLINANTIQDLRDTKQGYELVSALGSQTNTLSQRFGSWYPNPPFSPYYYGTTYGTTIY